MDYGDKVVITTKFRDTKDTVTIDRDAGLKILEIVLNKSQKQIFTVLACNFFYSTQFFINHLTL